MVALWLVDAALITMLPADQVAMAAAATAAAAAATARWSELYSGPDVL